MESLFFLRVNANNEGRLFIYSYLSVFVGLVIAARIV